MDEAEALQEAGIFSLVLECVPEEVAALISAKLDIPVIGIGAGSSCDGQVLVFHDLVGYASQLQPKFVKRYADVGTSIRDAVRDYVSEVKERRFPAPEHVFHAKEEMVSKLYGGGGLRS